MILQGEILSHLLVTFIYFLLVSILRWKLDFSLFWLWVGALLGTFFLDLDHLLYWFYLHPDEPDSQEAQRVWREKRTEGLGELKEILEKSHHTHLRLIFHTAVFQVVLIILAFYIVSSGGSILASSFVMAINLHLLKDEWSVYKVDRTGLVDWLFWQVKGIPMEKYLDL